MGGNFLRSVLSGRKERAVWGKSGRKRWKPGESIKYEPISAKTRRGNY